MPQFPDGPLMLDITVTPANVVTVSSSPTELLELAVPSIQGPPVDATLTTANAAGNYPLNVSQNGVYDLTLTGNVTFSITGQVVTMAHSIILVIRQDATGGRLITWPAGTRWAAGQPNLSTTPNTINVVNLLLVNGLLAGFPAGELI